MYENEPPKGAVKGLTKVILRHKEMLAQFMGVTPKKKPKKQPIEKPVTEPVYATAKSAQPVGSSPKIPETPVQSVDDEYPEENQVVEVNNAEREMMETEQQIIDVKAERLPDSEEPSMPVEEIVGDGPGVSAAP